MKKTIVLLAGSVIALFAVAGVTHAQMGMMGGHWQNSGDITQVQESQEMTGALTNIYASQNISSQAEVDCSAVIDDQFDTLGDAYMGIMLPNVEQHAAMDAMMGGEGSESLRQAHINMGRSYLGCWSDYNSGPVFMPMMGGFGMVGTGAFDSDVNKFNHNYMMGFGGFGGGFIMILFWVLVIGGIIMLIKYFMGSDQTTYSSKSAMDILKERYAKGELEKEEFESKKKDLL